MKQKIELLAPGGDVDSIKAAIAAGANAVYLGLNKFNARNRAENIQLDQLNGILGLAHEHVCMVFLTLNIVVLESEIPNLISLLNKIVNTSIDGVIVQDLGLFYLLNSYFPTLKIHASTQLNTHNEGQVQFLHQLKASRVNLSRELSLAEIEKLTAAAHQLNLLTEVFVHGSYCISFSGICYMSGGNSGNRGRCSQPCRDEYQSTSIGNNFPLNLKDNSAFFDIESLVKAGVDSLKIEGRIKRFHYVFAVVDAYRKQLNRILNKQTASTNNADLFKVFNRDFSNAYLKGEIGKAMFIDQPLNNSLRHLLNKKGGADNFEPEQLKLEIFADKANFRLNTKSVIDRLSIEKAPVQLIFSGLKGSPLGVSVKTQSSQFEFSSEKRLADTGNFALDEKELLKRFKAINDTEYYIDQIDLQNLHFPLYLPFSELTILKNKILFRLNDSKSQVEAVKLPTLKQNIEDNRAPSLSVLIDSENDINLYTQTTAAIHFKLPNNLKHQLRHLVELFTDNPKLIPWFPAVLIDSDFDAALEFLRRTKPDHIVTNNTGVAYQSNLLGINWVAGPYLNIVNSYSLICLKQFSNCVGAFLSNELNRYQIQSIKKPDNFKLLFSIYHPIVLMTSRQCLLQQVQNCGKTLVDEDCLHSCNKRANITNLKHETFIIEKKAENYHRVYNEENYLNTEIVSDRPNKFSGFFIDLSNVKTQTNKAVNNVELIILFQKLLAGRTNIGEELKKHIRNTTQKQYEIGI